MPDPDRRGALHLVASKHEGAEIADCAACPHRDTLRASGRCVPGDTCLVAHSGRQIDRFLRRNPEYAESCLHDAFWERRAIAVRYAPLAAIQPLARDADEVVRRAVALSLPADELAALRFDADREVRITVAERLPHGRLTRMLADPEREVRKAVARRLPAFALKRMAGDSDEEVRRIVAARLLPADAVLLLADDDWLVRLEAARQAPAAALAALEGDPEPDVRALARARRNREEPT